jgi:hypothetical protein
MTRGEGFRMTRKRSKAMIFSQVSILGLMIDGGGKSYYNSVYLLTRRKLWLKLQQQLSRLVQAKSKVLSGRVYTFSVAYLMQHR